MTLSSGQRSKEVRLGVVMYGGVSLAIYINGVSQELFRAVQGQGIYKLLKLYFDTDIVLDIVSGTSAGGINGLLLAYALANGKDFSSTKELWRESGDIELLMQEANVNPQSCKSLLNSDDYYRAQLAKAFLKIDRQDFDATGCTVSEFNEMDVFITGTAFVPDIYTTFDDAGRAIEMQDYRKVFRLKHRAQRSNKGAFRPDDKDKATRFQALAKLARITSCFPGAFLPVRVLSADDWEGRDPIREEHRFPSNEKDVDALLCEWGALKKSCYYLDGGVLDNKPFTPTIGAIFGRTADRPIDRILFYIEPDPEIVPASEGAPNEPSFLSSVIGGVVGISTYQSVTDDAKQIEEHNTQVVRHSAVCEELQGKLNSVVGSGAGIPADLAEPQRTLYISARNTELASRAIKGLLWNSETGTGEHLTSAADREIVKSLFRSLNETRKSTELSYDETFQSYDIYFRQRRLQHVVNWLYELLRQPNQQEAQTIQQLLKGLNQHIQLLEIVQYWFEYALDRISVDWRSAREKADPWTEIWAQVSALVKQVLAAHGSDSLYLPVLKPLESNWLSATELDKINASMSERVHRILKSDPSATSAPKAPEVAAAQDTKKPRFTGLLQWTDEAEAAFFETHNAPSAAYENAHKEYTQFAGLDAIVFPLNFLSNLANQNEVRLLRISPAPTVDQNNRGIIGFRADAGADAKLAGTRLGHFAGFLKRSWRSNDILWGRLDGLRHIVLALFTPDRLKQLAADDGLRAKIRTAMGDNTTLRQLLEECFPHSPSASHDKIDGFLAKILSPGGYLPSVEVLYEHLDLLVEMGQLEIIAEELPVVLQDAAVQQSEWNRFRRAPSGRHTDAAKAGTTKSSNAAIPEMPPSTFASPPGFVDPALVGLRVKEELERLNYFWKSKNSLAANPKQTGLGDYFEKTYDVAGEGLERGIPPLILVQQMTRLLLVLNACLLGTLPPVAQNRVQGNWLYKLTLSLPLKVSFRLTTLWIREPKMTAISLTSLLAASAVAFGLACYFISGQLMHKVPGTFTTVGLVLFPFIFLVISLILLLKRRKFAL
jgi:patatin-related protein